MSDEMVPARDPQMEALAGLEGMTDEEWEAACLEARENPRFDRRVYRVQPDADAWAKKRRGK